MGAKSADYSMGGVAPMKWIIGLLIFIASSTAAAQTTQPAQTPPWPATVKRFAEALAAGNGPAAAAICDPQAVVRSFGVKDASDLNRVLASISGGTLLGAHGYLFPPLAVGADMAADFKNAKGIPDDVKQRMIPQDDDAMKRANATAVQWLADALGARQDDPVGVIVFWHPNRASESLLGAAAPQVIFVLVKAEAVTTSQFHITLCVYGNPLAAAD